MLLEIVARTLTLIRYYSMAKPLTTEQFIEKARKLHGDNYDYSKVKYINSRTKVCIICPIHGEFWIKPNNHLRGQGCMKCGYCLVSLKLKKTLAYFIEKSVQVHGDNYNYSEVTYQGMNEKVKIICPKHGEFWMRPHDHIRGQGCPQCAIEIIASKERKNNELFFIEARQIHGDKYDYSKVDYKNNKTKVCIICPEHGEFWQTPQMHINRKRGCPICNESKLERTVRLLLTEQGIDFVYQKKFSWLGLLSLDFYLPKYNVAIECQGKQHFEPVEHFGGEKGFEISSQRDKLKLELCKEHDVQIIYYSDEEGYSTFLDEPLVKTTELLLERVNSLNSLL